MRYGFYLPTRGPTATREGILSLAREGERLGFHSAMIADHIVLPVESQSTYPYTLDGKHPSAGDALETFSILGVVAGATERLRLVTSVLVLPYRNPVLTAKMVASLDVLSGGRVTLGVGAGWLKEEFEALNSPAFEARGAVTDEWITIFKQLWSQSPASFDGRFYRYSDIHCEPFPVQKPHPPIWVGGHSRAALRRTARHGNGWHPVGAIVASTLPPQRARAARRASPPERAAGSAAYPMLAWRWSIELPIRSPLDERTREGDDHPARLFLRFATDRGEKRAMEVIWGNRLKPGDYKYIGSFPHFVADAGDDRVGRWLDERIDLARVYAEIWKDAAPAHLVDVAVFCDSDDTHTASISYFAYVRLERR